MKYFKNSDDGKIYGFDSVTQAMHIATLGPNFVSIDYAPVFPITPAPDYRELRSKNYPPITDYLDAVVKGDKKQMKAYTDDCLAVKKQFPKPTN